MKTIKGKVSLELLRSYKRKAEQRDYGVPKWLQFALHFAEQYGVKRDVKVSLYSARKTYSKYVTISANGENVKVRFSNHKPNFEKELNNDCDYFVGPRHNGRFLDTETVKALVETDLNLNSTYLKPQHKSSRHFE